jgi:hypothetical protein
MDALTLCPMCNGSGWKNHYPFPITKDKPVFIYVPCLECKGTGWLPPPTKGA